MISDTEYENLYKKSQAEALDILKKTDFSKYSEEKDDVLAEKLFWNLLLDYIEGRIPELTMILICMQYEGEPVHHNMSSEAKAALYKCIRLDDVTYHRVDEAEALEIRNNLRLDVKNYFSSLNSQ